MPPLYPLAVALGNYIHLTQTLALVFWLLVVVLLFSAFLPPAGALGCREFVMGESCLLVEIQILCV